MKILKQTRLRIKNKLIAWLAPELTDELVFCGFVHKDDFEDYFENEVGQNNFITPDDLDERDNQLDDNMDRMRDDLEELGDEFGDAQDNIQDIHARLEAVEKFLKNRYGFGEEDVDGED